MANRIVLNPVSYHGVGAVKEIVTELTNRGFKRALSHAAVMSSNPVRSTKSPICWMLQALLTHSIQTLNPTLPLKTFRMVSKLSRNSMLTALSPSAAVL